MLELLGLTDWPILLRALITMVHIVRHSEGKRKQSSNVELSIISVKKAQSPIFVPWI
jgi:hypothetical protein